MVRRIFSTIVIVALATSSGWAGGVVLKKPSDSVVAAITASTCACSGAGRLVDSRLIGDGTTTPFVIPPGTAFMVTGFDFRSLFAPVGTNVLAFLSVEGVGCTTGYTAIALSSAVGMPGVTAGTVDLTTPIRVFGNTELCINMSGTSNVFGSVRGFFTKDK